VFCLNTAFVLRSEQEHQQTQKLEMHRQKGMLRRQEDLRQELVAKSDRSWREYNQRRMNALQSTHYQN